MKVKTKTIKQSTAFKASPNEVYEALVDSKKHSKFTGSRAVVSNKVGGKFSVYGGALYGKNLSLSKNKKIVQQWACEMKGWPKDHFSRATISIKKVRGGTNLSFMQTGVPAACYKDISDGWKKHYWNAMKRAFKW
mgnify:CR=1 FL=1